MSRTHKDKPWKLVDPESRWDFGMERVPYQKWSNEFQYWYNAYCYIERGGVKTKKKRTYHERNWMRTPMWWIREYMTQPQRTRGKEWERQIVKVAPEDLLDQPVPNVDRKPHWYYW